MSNTYSLTKNNGASDITVTTAGTVTCDPITLLDGMQAASVQLRFVYGSGGTNCKAYVQTSFDQGNSWVDTACVVFTTANETQMVNLSGLTPKGLTVPTDGTLTDDTVLDGFLGDRFRVKVISTGTYAGGTTLSVRTVVR
jgi:hypothetical protein